MKVSFIVPVKNEENSIAGVVEGIKKCVPAASEIIVIDDGSTDATAANASAAGARVISHNINMGKGCAIRTGIKAASGDVIVFIDGDGQDDPADAAAMLAEMERGFDFVNGSRFLGILEKGSITTLHRYGNIFMTSLINLLFSSKISDSQAGFRAVRLDKIRGWELSAQSYEIETEMLIKALKQGLRIKEVPVTRKKRTGGSSHFRTVINGMRILFFILKERLAG